MRKALNWTTVQLGNVSGRRENLMPHALVRNAAFGGCIAPPTTVNNEPPLSSLRVPSGASENKQAEAKYV